MSLAVGLIFSLALVACGWWPMRRWGAHWSDSPWWSRAALAAALGVVFTGYVQWTLSLLGVATGPWPPLLLALLSLTATRARWGLGAGDGQALTQPGQRGVPGTAETHAPAEARAQQAESPGPADAQRTESPAESAEASPSPWGQRALVCVVLGLALVSAGVGLSQPFMGDGSKFWAMRARELAHDPVLSVPSLTDADRAGFHPNYPLLVPLVLAPVFAWSPPDAAVGPKLVLQLLALSLLALLARLLWPLGAAGRWALVAFASMPGWTSLDVREGFVSGGYVDVTCALFLLLLVEGVDRLRQERVGRQGIMLCVLAAGGLVSTKLEGGVELLIVALAWILAGPLRARAALLLGGAGLLALPALITRQLVLAAPESPRLAFLMDPEVLLARGAPLLIGLAGMLLDVSCFGLLPLLLLGLSWSGRRRLGPLLPWLLLGVAGFLVAAYLASPMHVSRHLYTSVHRLGFHWMAAIAVLIARAASRGAGLY